MSLKYTNYNMKKFDLKNMFRGWFVGNFEPTAFKTDKCEVARQTYKKGDHEKKHMHKIATEITAIIKGEVKMNGKEYSAGDIITIEPGEATDFEALTDVENIVVKIPGAMNDKYIVED